jgi:hypothetical protein
MSSIISQLGLLLNPGRIYVTKASVQQVVWLAKALGIDYKYQFISKLEELSSCANIDYDTEVIYICDATTIVSKQIPVGFVVSSSFNNIVIICGSCINNLVDNSTIWELDLNQADGLQFTEIALVYSRANPTDRDLKVRQFLNNPSGLYRSLVDDCTNHLLETANELAVFTTALQALTNTKSIQSYWVEISKSRGMQLFAHDNSFLSYLSKNERQGACRGLAPLLQPFVHRFRQTYEVSYLQAGGRWLLYSRLHWADQFRTGVQQYGSGYYCNFSEKALHHWAEIVSDLEIN